ncbi:hypothetical protein [Streptomyces sp. SID3343]|uniref:hypothetical protein n=1 Tax=Streptomyces sp. SID3343 TaxID=2690260 RepID=UPI00137040C7|nr:hypothetical protein [Streptomyces sp. SID3343]
MTSGVLLVAGMTPAVAEGGYMNYQTVSMLFPDDSTPRVGTIRNDRPANTCIAFPDLGGEPVVIVTNNASVTLRVWEKPNCTGKEFRLRSGAQASSRGGGWVSDPKAVSFDKY